jgi:hypothetical protein
LGQGSSGGGGTSNSTGCQAQGGGGSSGSGGASYPCSYRGGDYGGGSAVANISAYKGGVGAVRIIWPGNTRSFPSTCAGNP